MRTQKNGKDQLKVSRSSNYSILAGTCSLCKGVGIKDSLQNRATLQKGDFSAAFSKD